MPEVLEIRELGGEEPKPASAGADVHGPGPESARADTIVRWRRWAAAGVVATLFLAVVYLLAVGGPRSGGASGGSKSEAAVESFSVEQAAQAALDAWARFASTGDLAALAGTFDVGGPQFARLRAEAAAVAAAALAPGSPYAFSATVRGVEAGQGQDELVVVADIVVTRVGETDQRFAWELDMRRSDGWRLWTARDRAVEAASAQTGGAR